MKPLMLGAGQLCFYMFLYVKEMNVVVVYEINHIIRTAQMKSNECECLEQAILLQGLMLLFEGAKNYK